MIVIVRVPVTYTSVTVVTSCLVIDVHSDSDLHSHIAFTEYIGNPKRSKTLNYAFFSNTKNIMYLQG